MLFKVLKHSLRLIGKNINYQNNIQISVGTPGGGTLGLHVGTPGGGTLGLHVGTPGGGTLGLHAKKFIFSGGLS